jgi:EpsI family protein
MRLLMDVALTTALAVGLLLTFADPLLAMVGQWSASPMYSYGYSVPVISAFLLWSRRRELARLPIAPQRLPAAAVLGVAIALLAAGRIGAVQVVQQVAFLIAIAGIVLFLFGRAHLRVSAPALAYLLFMVPLWDAFTEPLHWPFQNNSTHLGVAILQTAGIPAHRDGVFVALPNLLIEVARECSGINYLVAVIALALPVAFLRLRSPWRRALLIGSAVAIAALANGLRVALIGALAYHEVGSPLHGPFHVLHGLFVAGVGYVVLFAGLHLLQQGESSAATQLPPAPVVPPRWHVRDAAGLAVLFWMLVVSGVSPQASPVSPARPLDAFPYSLGAWSLDLSATSGGAADEILLPWEEADHRTRRRYRDGDGRTVTVDIHYFELQTQARKVANYRVVGLHRDSTTWDVRLLTGTTMRVNALSWPDRDEVAVFWYDFGGVPESDYHAARLRTAWRALRTGRSHGAAVIVRTRASSLGDAEPALRTVAAEVHRALQPIWAPQ